MNTKEELTRQIKRLRRKITASEKLMFTPVQRKALDLPIDTLGLPTRISNDLRGLGISNIRELLVVDEDRLIFETPTIELQSLKIIATSFATVGIGSALGLPTWWRNYIPKPGAKPRSLQDFVVPSSARESQKTKKAMSLVAKYVTPQDAAKQAGIHPSTIYRAIERRFKVHEAALREFIACSPANPPK